MTTTKERVLETSLDHNAEIIRAYDIKAQVYIIAYLVFFQVIVHLKQIQGGQISARFLTIFAVALCFTIYLFMRVLVPKLGGSLAASMGNKRDTFFFHSRPTAISYEQHRKAFTETDAEEVLLIEQYKLQLLRASKESRFAVANSMGWIFLAATLALIAFPEVVDWALDSVWKQVSTLSRRA